MRRILLFALICCSTVKGAGLDASDGAVFGLDGVEDCVQSNNGGFGVSVAPLVGCLETFGQSEFKSAASASAAFGTLRVLGSTSATNLSVPAGHNELEWFLRADADFQDTLTIAQGSFLSVTVNFSGTESNAGAFFFLDGATKPTTFPGPNTFLIPYRAGVPFLFSEGLRVDLSDSLMIGQPQGQSFAEFVDLSHTVQIVSTEVLDSQGNVIPGVAIGSESGFDYNNPLGTSAVPEPSSVFFLGMVCLGIAAASIRNKRKGFCRS
jgi:PEP-CTERM motif